MIVGVSDFTMLSGQMTPAAMIPMPDFAVPYEAPMLASEIEATAPRAAKNGSVTVSLCSEYPLISTYRIDWTIVRRHDA